ncbi:hypothetical protein FEM03_22150 [Phragmitibacter flavus]|uniref:Twin-arginine translocation signal domain-containing protein n=1 Tax=Phragmitibacter flavus TaxID=2576071 RepID=A0A5R8K878_9BACT|nr:twin-arginine translocation signal domain-containing protein [Phragmitibacter flavus]TLD68510.1 hypothetical protein FEM03_22150 [Phragmitibacter flavus]
MNRRHFLRTTAAASAALAHTPLPAQTATSYPPIRPITSGPPFHWFGYYDKLQFESTNRYALTNQVDFEGRSPTPTDSIKVGMIDTQTGQWTEFGTSTAWGWQQGCMLQWVPGSDDHIIWNDRENGQYISRILNIKTREQRTLPLAIYSLSPDGKYAVCADFARIDFCRSGYGYSGIDAACKDEKIPAKSGIWRMDLQTGEHEIIFSLADAAAVKHPTIDLSEKWNWFNHLLVAQDSKRVIFLHRWRDEVDIPRDKKTGGFTTRMFTINIDGTEPHVLEPSGVVSHFIWRDPDHLVAWARPEAETEARVILYKDKTREYTKIGVDTIPRDGHMTYVPNTNNEWMLCDTYPDKVTREQTPFLLHIATDKRIDLGKFVLPADYKGEFRCDLHPRCTNDGRKVIIDSPHGGQGRQMWEIDISGIVS